MQTIVEDRRLPADIDAQPVVQAAAALKPDPEPQVRAKFRELAGAHLTPAGIDAIEAAVDRCEEWKTMGDLIEPLRMYAS